MATARASGVTRTPAAAGHRIDALAVPADDAPVVTQRSRPQESFDGDSHASTAFGEILDRTLHAMTARSTGCLSPLALISAYLDWAAHLAFSPRRAR